MSGTDSVLVSEIIPASRERIYSAWLDSRQHSAFTGEEARIEPTVGGKHSAFGGYASGRNIELEPNRRIVQTWRTSEFPPEFRDSRLVVEFEPTRGGTRVVVRHSDLPPSQLKRYEKGWTEHYLKPLARYFAKGAKQKTPAPIAPETSWGRKQEPARRPQKGARTVQKAAARKSASKPTRRRAAPKRKSGSRRPKR